MEWALQGAVPHSGNVVTVGAPIPDDSSLCGLTAYVQAVVFGSPGPTLTNALELVLGQ